jgi:hypothetical protein
MSTSNRHPFALLGAAASLITVLGFIGVKGWASADTGSSDTGSSVTGNSVTGNFVTPAAGANTYTPKSTVPAATGVTCTITDELGEGQVAENVRIAISGRTYDLSIGSARTKDALRLRFTGPGSHSYAIATATEFTTGASSTGEGRGTFRCDGGETYALVGDYDTEPATVTLEAD